MGVKDHVVNRRKWLTDSYCNSLDDPHTDISLDDFCDANNLHLTLIRTSMLYPDEMRHCWFASIRKNNDNLSGKIDKFYYDENNEICGEVRNFMIGVGDEPDDAIQHLLKYINKCISFGRTMLYCRDDKTSYRLPKGKLVYQKKL